MLVGLFFTNELVAVLHTSLKMRGMVAVGSLFWSACSNIVKGTACSMFSVGREGIVEGGERIGEGRRERREEGRGGENIHGHVGGRKRKQGGEGKRKDLKNMEWTEWRRQRGKKQRGRG